ncbi:class D sortase [Bacillus taeanensis]|uniref:Class D sortase n=1 Tax=Bacillus taeanensis TaxID=273032 RepID=A0A366XN37_9BACI|nr:class D sortase [Bacillus taeanensis]RBW67317.1 class D sortase [Bacillus taeanensis]
MWKRWAAAVFIAVGVVMLTSNVSSLILGLSASSKPIIHEDEFAEKEKVKAEAKEKLYSDVPEIGEEIGVLTIPKLNRSLSIFQGTDAETLKKGVGHYPRSVLPGERNNSILSGHRDTAFRGLGNIGINDVLIVSTKAGEFLYKVKKVRIVDKDDQTVMVPKPKSTLTITTCYPFHFIGDAEQRYVLVADLLRTKTPHS